MSSEGETNSREIPAQPQAPVDSRSAANEDNMSVGTYETSYSRDSQRNRGYPTKRRRDDSDYSRNGINFRKSSSRSESRNRDSRSFQPSVPRESSQSRDRSEGWRRGERRNQPSRSYNAPLRSKSLEGGNRAPLRSKSLEGGNRDHRSVRSASRSASRGNPRSEFCFSGRFRSISKSRSPGRMLAAAAQEIREWPPCFDTDGSDFVFDSRSAMFYEAESNFFYDPKSKLYYGNKKLAYFRYDETKDPPFVEIQKMAPTESNDANNDAAVAMPAPESTPRTIPTAKPMIAIKLKTKKLKKPKVAAPKLAPPLSKVQKEQAANIEKWTEKKAELKAEIVAAAVKAEPFAAASDASLSVPTIDRFIPAAAVGPTIRKSAKGEPICVLCKRKFPTVEKLRLHERVSDLHRQNLEKFEANNAKRKEVPQLRLHERVSDLHRQNLEKFEASIAKRKEVPQPLDYQDRAQKRRALHGPQTPPRSAVAKVGLKEAPSGSDSLGSDNIGNQMLHRLGWESGASLGRKCGDASDSGTNGKGSQPNHEGLRKDWEKIESLAKKGAPGPPRP